MNIWKQFAETKNGFLLREFFVRLNREIANVDVSSKIKGAVLMLNTRKGYWIYKIFSKNEADQIEEIEVCSDRYAKKILDFSSMKGKIVYLVDDTLSQGTSLMETYELLVKHLDSQYICPIVFAIQESVKIEEKIKQCSGGTQKEFWEKLQYYVRLTEEELGSFCVSETELIHAEGIPFVVDLPYLKSAEEKQELNFSVKLSQEQFKALQKDDKRWKFHLVSCDYGELGEGRKAEFKGFIVQMRDERLSQLTEEFAHDFIIEGSYRENDKKDIYAIFIPFAILKSQSLEFQKELWSALFPEKAREYMDGRQENVQRKRYRENVFVLSMMIAEMFRDFLKERTGIELQYDYQILYDHFTGDFIKEMQQLEASMKKDDRLISRRLEQMAGMKNMGRYHEKAVFCDKQLAYSEKEAGELFSKEIRKRRDAIDKLCFSSVSYMNEQAVLSFEEIQHMFDRTFYYQSLEEKKYALTREIILMLNVSICSNKLILDEKNGRIIRGFRYGENSDLLLPFFNKYFYWAVLLLKMKYSEKEVALSYDKFVIALKKQFQELDFLNSDIEQKDFERNVEYYKAKIKDGTHLNNKYCFVLPYLQGRTGKADCYYMGKIEEFIKKYGE